MCLLDKFCEIEKQYIKQEAFRKQQLAYIIADYKTIGLKSIVNGEIFGFEIARVNIRRKVIFGYIVTIDVAPTYRRKGIAQRLFYEIETLIKGR